MENRTDLPQKIKTTLKTVCFILCLVMAMSSFSACSKKEPTTADNSSSENTLSDITSSEESENIDDSEETTDDYFEDTFESDDYFDDDFTYEDEPTVLKVYNSRKPVNENYMGMNATVWHTFGFMDDGRKYTDEMLDIELNRLDEMGFMNMRTNFYPSWLWNGGGFDFNAPRMKEFLEYCTALQKRGKSVMYNQMWYMSMLTNVSTARSDGYLNGFGEDKYGEQASFSDCIATEFKLTGSESPKEAGMGDKRPGVSVKFYEDNVTDYFNRLAISSLRYGVFISNVLKTAKANGVNNIDYILYFTEPSYYHYTPGDNKGPHEQEYIFICRTIRNVLEKTGVANGVKHVGPNQGHITDGDGLLQYVIEKDPDLFDVLTSHFYPIANDPTADVYYDYNYNAIGNYRDTMEKAGLWGKKEFWQDEMAAKQNNVEPKRQKQVAVLGPQTIVSAICSQQMGVDNVLFWQAFDQAFTNYRENASEFEDGIHITGVCPSLFVSSTPYKMYYSIGLFTRYNNSGGGKAIATSSGDYEDYPGVYIGATELPDGNITITVVNLNIDLTEFTIEFDKPIGRDLHRHVEDTLHRVPKTFDPISYADCSFKDVQTTLKDTIDPFAVHIYTTCKY